MKTVIGGVRAVVLLLAILGLAVVAVGGRSEFARETYRVSVGSGGVEGDALSAHAEISSDGRFIAFASRAANLGGGTSQTLVVYIYDQVTRRLRPVVTSGGDTYPTDISPDGRYVVMSSMSIFHTGTQDVTIYDRQSGSITCASVDSAGVCDHGGNSGSISADGRYVVFASSSPDLVSGDTNTCGNWYTTPGRCPDIFLHDRDADGNGVFDESGGMQTTRLSVGLDGTQSDGESGHPVITPDGRFVAFWSNGSSLVSGDDNAGPDVFVLDRDPDVDGLYDEAGQTTLTRVSVSQDGTQSGGGTLGLDISDDGRFVVFTATGWYGHECASGPNYYACTDIYLYLRENGQAILITKGWDDSAALGRSLAPRISGDSVFVTFFAEAEANNLVQGDDNEKADVFLYNRVTGEMALVSQTPGGAPANGDSGYPVISGDGGFVAFDSIASDLVPGDTNAVSDVFANGVRPAGLAFQVNLPMIVR